MALDDTRVREYLDNQAFDDLFIEELGWEGDHYNHDVPVNDKSYSLQAVAHKRGMTALVCNAIPDYETRRKIDRETTKLSAEHLIIYTNQHEQVWQWVRRDPGTPLRPREIKYPEKQGRLFDALDRIKFSFEEEEDLTIVDVSSRVRAAFDVEQVTRRFYDEFKKQHTAFLNFLQGIPDEELQRWYASVMLNRLMFIYFVQKKGFLASDHDYLNKRLEIIEADNKNFYSDFLIPLFFEGFALKPEDRSRETRQLLGEVPYLNGGLFMPHQLEEQYGDQIMIENKSFKKLFAFFDQYHWHLDDRPLRQDDEINPEVLGYIFEKYINQKQMGAYYTKEDITEYISRNTVIPYLFDVVQKKVREEFEGEHNLWDFLVESPDRYIYPAVRHGANGHTDIRQILPDNIAAGLDDVSQRDDWNTPTPDNIGLPTEIWRETVARLQRYFDLRSKLLAGEVREINDLITYNLDIQQFAQDVISYTDSPTVIRAMWKAVNEVTVLDPTCGSGAFLFAAMNILEPLYEGCLERMQEYVETSDNQSPSQQYSDFKKVLARINQHPNRRYFIYKSITVNNLFGVDIMEEAVEICKLRLFLKLVAQIDDEKHIEPLPDIDFNIRAGNTLVGFASRNDVRNALAYYQAGPNVKQQTFFNATEESALTKIEERASDIDKLFDEFRAQQTQYGGEVTGEDKAILQDRLSVLAEELNELLARQYGVNLNKHDEYSRWLRSHQPFHWFVEFYGVLKSGGFDVIIGNPPYVEYRTVKNEYWLLDDFYNSLEANNLYAYCMERSSQLVSVNGWLGMIVPTSVIGLDKTYPLRQVLLKRFNFNVCSTYGIRPSKLFDRVDQRLCIYVAQRSTSQESVILTTRYHRWYSDERSSIFQCLDYHESFYHPRLSRIPQIGSREAAQVIQKIETKNNLTIENYFSNGHGYSTMHYHRSPRYWIRAIDFEPYFKSETRTRSVHHFRDLYFRNAAEGKAIGALLNSSVFFFWFLSIGNGRNITSTDINSFPIGEFDDEVLTNLPVIFDQLMQDYKDNSIIRVRKDSEFQEFYQSKSKHIIDKLDRWLAQHYGFTDQELDFIINYDIKYRMGDDLFDDDADEED